ncbi:YrhK family protein [Streptomyces anthocyanicus]|uniref:YrhK family protein n=1 Tax=Streptomyces anthocyanicus TaxID=68174 RepID=UPI0033E1592C
MEGLCLKRRQEPCRPGGCGVDTGPPPLLRPLSEPSPDRRPQHGPCCWDAATPPACCTAPAGRLHSPAPSRCHWLGCWCRQQAGIRGRAPPVHRGLGRARRPGRRPRSARDRGGEWWTWPGTRLAGGGTRYGCTVPVPTWTRGRCRCSVPDRASLRRAGSGAGVRGGPELPAAAGAGVLQGREPVAFDVGAVLVVLSAAALVDAGGRHGDGCFLRCSRRYPTAPCSHWTIRHGRDDGVLPRLERYLLQDFPFIHLIIGGFGNTAFLVGSVCFLFPSLERIALWLFVLGSLGMFVGSLGEVFVRHARKSRRRTQS